LHDLNVLHGSLQKLLRTDTQQIHFFPRAVQGPWQQFVLNADSFNLFRV